MVELRGITKRFPGVVANDGISLRFNAGEIHVLLGENGAGKSTLIGILAGMLTGLERARHERAVCVPCDSPVLPTRRGSAASCGEATRRQAPGPVCCPADKPPAGMPAITPAVEK